MDHLLEKFYEKGLNTLNRRNFLVGAGATGAAAVLVGCNDATVTPPVATTPAAFTDVDILNFALNLEYLEAEFYLRAATGNGLAAADTGGTGTVTVPTTTKIPSLTLAQQNIVNEIAYDEQQHVRFLRSALGNAAVTRPNIDLTNGFANAVAAANSLGGAVSTTLPAIPTAFNPFGTFDQFLVGAFVFEDVGVTAYSGAAPLISAAGITAGYLSAAAGIQAVEAYHASYVRTVLSGNTLTQGYTAYPYALYANRISNLRAALGGGNETLLTGFTAGPATVATVGTTPALTTSIVAATPANAIAYARSTDQVLHIVYGSLGPNGATSPSAGLSSGLFFPNGLNGNIKTTAS